MQTCISCHENDGTKIVVVKFAYNLTLMEKPVRALYGIVDNLSRVLGVLFHAIFIFFFLEIFCAVLTGILCG